MTEERIRAYPADYPKRVSSPSQSGQVKESQVSQIEESQVEEGPTTRGSQTDMSSQPLGARTTAAEAIRNWTSDMFDINFDFLKSIRGLLIVFHFFVSMLTLSLIGAGCHMHSSSSTFAAFYCGPTDTFVFVVACSACLTSLMLLICFVFSKATDEMLLNSAFEVTYYIAYSSIFLIGSLTLLTNVYSRNKGQDQYEDKYERIIAGASFGIINSILYGASTIWFLLLHRMHGAEHTPSTNETE